MHRVSFLLESRLFDTIKDDLSKLIEFAVKDATNDLDFGDGLILRSDD
jgi:hypothetical protein